MTVKSAIGRTYPKIHDTSRTLPRIDPAQVASALGAEESLASFSGAGGPLTLYQVRQELFKRLRSTGGRPALSETSMRAKIPLSQAQWDELEAIAAEVASPGFSPSAGQIASVLLSLSLRALRHSKQED